QWFPFLIGYALGGGFSSGPPVVLDTGPGYRYPPTDSISRGGTAYGGTTATKPQTFDFDKTKSVPNAVSGLNGGVGGGNAATNKSSGGNVQSGQAGGSGSGSAATSKSSGGLSGLFGGSGSGTAATNKAPTGFGGGIKPSISFKGGKP